MMDMKRQREQMASYWGYWGKARPASNVEAQYHLLPYHCLDVAVVGKVYLQNNPRLLRYFSQAIGVPDREILDWLTFCLALHDLGKFAVTFQAQRSDLLEELQHRASARPYTVRHDTLGERLWLKLLESAPQVLGLGPDSRRYRSRLQPWIGAVTGHHGQPPGVMSDSLLAHFEQSDIDAAAEFVAEARRLLLPDRSLQKILAVEPELHAEQSRRLSWWLAGVAVLADWLGSNTRYFKYCDQSRLLSDYWDGIQEIGEKALADSGVMPQPPAAGKTLQTLFTTANIQQLTPLQQWAETTPLPKGPQLYFAEDVTGAGKTEAALTLAYRLMEEKSVAASGIFVALPTMATANAMFERVVTMATYMFMPGAVPSCVLAHGQRHLSESFKKIVLPVGAAEGDVRQQDETATARCSAWLSDHNKKALLAAMGVGTVDQALLAVLHARHQSLRLLGLFGKVLIVDEVHACDSYMQELLERLLCFHAAAGGHAILLSATLTLVMKQKLATAFADGAGWSAPLLRSKAYPLATSVHHTFASDTDERHVETRDSVRRSVQTVYVSEKNAIENLILTKLAEGRCVCWVRNTVADAVHTWEKLSAELPNGKCMLFHARFAMGDRLEAEDRIRDTFGPKSVGERRRGQLVIATQVVEQSLDVDFDVMISDLAPIDRIIQRAGRLQRHIRKANGDPGQGNDERGGAILHVFGPSWSDDPDADWFKSMFPGAAVVYSHHGQIWLTARFLREGQFSMPEDARRLIEGVFGDQEELPAGLQNNADQIQGQEWAKTNFAAGVALKLDTGYQRGGMNWHADDEAPAVGVLDDWQTPAGTRDGEATTTVRLAKRESTRIVPWCGDGSNDAWDLSSLRVVKRLIAQTDFPQGQDDEFAKAMTNLPDQGRWSVLLVLSQQENGTWFGQALDAEGRRRTWYYDTKSGLRQQLIGKDRVKETSDLPLGQTPVRLS